MNKLSNLDTCNWAYEGQLYKLETAVNADKNLIHKKDRDGRTPLHWAASAGHNNVVAFVLDNGGKVKFPFTFVYTTYF